MTPLWGWCPVCMTQTGWHYDAEGVRRCECGEVR
jgi:hypothetical protein